MTCTMTLTWVRWVCGDADTGRHYKTFWYMELYLLVRLAQCVGLLLNDLLTLVVLPRTSPHPLFTVLSHLNLF